MAPAQKHKRQGSNTHGNSSANQASIITYLKSARSPQLNSSELQDKVRKYIEVIVEQAGRGETVQTFLLGVVCKDEAVVEKIRKEHDACSPQMRTGVPEDFRDLVENLESHLCGETGYYSGHQKSPAIRDIVNVYKRSIE